MLLDLAWVNLHFSTSCRLLDRVSNFLMIGIFPGHRRYPYPHSFVPRSITPPWLLHSPATLCFLHLSSPLQLLGHCATLCFHLLIRFFKALGHQLSDFAHFHYLPLFQEIWRNLVLPVFFRLILSSNFNFLLELSHLILSMLNSADDRPWLPLQRLSRSQWIFLALGLSMKSAAQLILQELGLAQPVRDGWPLVALPIFHKVYPGQLAPR